MFAFAKHEYTFPATVVSLHLFYYLSLSLSILRVQCSANFSPEAFLRWQSAVTCFTDVCSQTSESNTQTSNTRPLGWAVLTTFFLKIFSNDWSILGPLPRKIQIHFLFFVLLRAVGVSTVNHYRYLQSSVAGLCKNKRLTEAKGEALVLAKAWSLSKLSYSCKIKAPSVPWPVSHRAEEDLYWVKQFNVVTSIISPWLIILFVFCYCWFYGAGLSWCVVCTCECTVGVVVLCLYVYICAY